MAVQILSFKYQLILENTFYHCSQLLKKISDCKLTQRYRIWHNNGFQLLFNTLTKTKYYQNFAKRTLLNICLKNA